MNPPLVCARWRGFLVGGPLLGVGLFGGLLSAAPPSFSFRPGTTYAPGVPSTAAVCGHEPGQRFVDHGDVLRVLDAICGASPRATLIEYGETHQGRPLLLALCSSERNLARISAIEEGLAALRDSRRTDAAEREALIAALPVVVWLSFSVHGNEPAGTEAALPLLYHLAACEDEDVQTLMDQAVVVIDPSLNPDGRDRYVRWFESVVGRAPNPDPQAMEHDEPWPGGRENGFHFDLNRDWAFGTQVETRARLKRIRRLPPQVHADLHEMGYNSSYFFFPAAPPSHRSVPEASRELSATFGRANAAAFDARGWVYYTAENFDLLFPGYGDSWPMLNGAIGMTYEQAGHSAGGLAVTRDDGDLLTLEDRAAHHFTAALTTIRTAVAERSTLLEHFTRFHEEAFWEGENGAIRSIALVPGRDAGRTVDLIEVLVAQGIEVERATAAFQTTGERFTDRAVEARTLPEGTYLVPLAQPSGRLARALLEPRATIRTDDFYDLSAWSLPMAFGVEALVLTAPLDVVREPVRDAPRPKGGIVGAGASVGYLVEWSSVEGPSFLNRVQGEGVHVSCLTREIRLGDRWYGPGTLFIPTRQRGAVASVDLEAVIDSAARATGVTAVRTSTGWTDEGPDLGSDTVVSLRPAKIALVGGPGVSATSYGACAHFLSARLGASFTALSLDDLGGVDLERYNVVVLPDGRGFRSRLKDGVDGLRAFVERGGILIALGGAAFALGDEGVGLVSVAARKRPDDDNSGKDGTDHGEDRSWMVAEQVIRGRERNVPGTFFRARLDPDRRLSFGAGEEIAVLLDSTRVFDPEGGARSIARLAAEPYLSGHVTPVSEAALAGGDYLVSASIGRGEVVLFAEDPLFRGFLRGQFGLFSNAVYLLGSP